MAKNEFIEMEEQVLDFWDGNKIFKKTLDKDSPKGDYIFYDGPPFATGTPHYGHLVASIIKDAVPRFWTMRGYHIDRVWGWDCHGLPIENIVEKDLGTNTKKEIEEKVGVERFNETARSKVFYYADEWKRIIRRLGRFVDMENAYRTMDKDFMESVWWVFKELWNKDLIYKDYRSMHICPRCETTLSQSEVTEGYKDIKDLSAVVKFESVKEPGTYLLAWTTTPWTLPGNVALAVGGDINYIKVKIEGKRYILAKMMAGSVLEGKDYEVEEQFKGADMVGLEYRPPFDAYFKKEDLDNKENGWKIYEADFVSTEEGTGIVHIAPAFGEDDMELGKERNLPFVQHVKKDGVFADEMGDFAGMKVKPKSDPMATDIEMIKYLSGKDLLFQKEKVGHSYPHCWRCDTPLLNYATSSWFVNIKKIKPKMLELAERIDWMPEHMKTGRFGNWLKGARDWSISRQRFWASVIPIWECECGQRKVVGSASELEELSGEKVDDLHKHVVDKIRFKCEECGGLMKRIPDVFDCWFESGSMPYASIHYPFENKERFDKAFPAEFIAEGSDQTRAWFYYLHAIATGLKESNAYNHVIVNGIVLAEDGKKMSKKLNNYPDPCYIMNTYGTDALRYYVLTSPAMMADNLNFSEKGVSDSLRKLNNILWNVYRFYETYAHPNSKPQVPNSENILDKWVIIRLNQLIKEVTEGMEAYNLPRATRPIAEFIDDLSTWYLRRSRDRFKGDDENDKEEALNTMGYALFELSKVLAPFTPFIAEQLYQKITGYGLKDGNRSVHLEDWPAFTEVSADDTLILDEMTKTRKVVELGLAKRDEAGIRIRQPLRELRITNCELREEYLQLVKDEINIKEIICEGDEGELAVEIDTELSSELIAEGVCREVIRTVNAMRKKNGLTVKDRVDIYYKAEGDIKKAIEDYKDQITKETLADSLEEGESQTKKEIKVNDENIILSINKK